MTALGEIAPVRDFERSRPELSDPAGRRRWRRSLSQIARLRPEMLCVTLRASGVGLYLVLMIKSESAE